LIADGPYQWVRHPFYLGQLNGALAAPVAIDSIGLGLIALLMAAIAVLQHGARSGTGCAAGEPTPVAPFARALRTNNAWLRRARQPGERRTDGLKVRVVIDGDFHDGDVSVLRVTDVPMKAVTQLGEEGHEMGIAVGESSLRLWPTRPDQPRTAGSTPRSPPACVPMSPGPATTGRRSISDTIPSLELRK